VDSSETVLRATGLELRRGSRTVVHGVDLALRRGEVVALLGPNGAGKSTLLSALAGLLEPAAGKLERSGRVAAALQAPALARRTALANVEAALAWWGVPRSERRGRALRALELLGAADHAHTPASKLSGGEQRRAHLARALAVEPDVLLLDEPFAGWTPPHAPTCSTTPPRPSAPSAAPRWWWCTIARRRGRWRTGC
jgi:ABC-type multidrug transport system ATPase subunit